MPSSERATESGRTVKRSQSCASCEACPAEAREACDEGPEPPYAGWALAQMAGFYFLLPVACALVGAALAPAGTAGRSLGALLGLLGGMLLTTAVAGRLTRRWEATAPRHPRGEGAASNGQGLKMASTGGARNALTAKETRDG